MNKSIRPDHLQNEQEIQEIPNTPNTEQSNSNALTDGVDEGDLLNDRTPAGDRGPEDSEQKKGSASDSQASY